MESWVIMCIGDPELLYWKTSNWWWFYVAFFMVCLLFAVLEKDQMYLFVKEVKSRGFCKRFHMLLTLCPRKDCNYPQALIIFPLFQLQIKSEKMQNEARVHQLENEIQHLSEKLKNMEEIQGLTDQQLQEADEEKERILAQLEYLENRVGLLLLKSLWLVRHVPLHNTLKNTALFAYILMWMHPTREESKIYIYLCVYVVCFVTSVE